MNNRKMLIIAGSIFFELATLAFSATPKPVGNPNAVGKHKLLTKSVPSAFNSKKRIFVRKVRNYNVSEARDFQGARNRIFSTKDTAKQKELNLIDARIQQLQKKINFLKTERDDLAAAPQ